MSRKKSVEEHVRDGTYRRDRHGPLPDGLSQAGGADQKIKPPKKPAGMEGDASEFWNRMVKVLAGVVRDRDADVLAEMCWHWAELRRIKRAIAEKEPGESGYAALFTPLGICTDKFDKFASRFGLTPADRAKLKVEASGPPVAKVPTRPKTKLDRQGPPKG